LLALSGGRSYNWKPLTGLSDTRIQAPYFKLKDSKVMYTITIIDSAGCVFKDQQEVWAFEKPDIFIASGFSPNNDGINDIYAPEYVFIKYLEYFKIADKNNRQIFITNDMKAKWDGTYRGTPLPPDPYVVVVSGIDIYGKKITKQGILILVK
jgi:gliding motility-associated-like protein